MGLLWQGHGVGLHPQHGPQQRSEASPAAVQLAQLLQLCPGISTASNAPPDYWYGPLKYSRTDLVASQLQRARDMGLPTYNRARQHFGLRPLHSWQDLGPHLEQQVTGTGLGTAKRWLSGHWGCQAAAGFSSSVDRGTPGCILCLQGCCPAHG